MPCDSLSRFYNKCVNDCCELLRSNYDPNEKNLDGKSLQTKSAMQHSERLEKQVGTWITLRRPRPRHHANVLLTFFWMRPASRSLVTPVASVERPQSRGPRPKPQRVILQARSKFHEDVGRISIRGRTIIIDAASITFDFALCVCGCDLGSIMHSICAFHEGGSPRLTCSHHHQHGCAYVASRKSKKSKSQRPQP